jgi:hypothetical protein
VISVVNTNNQKINQYSNKYQTNLTRSHIDYRQSRQVTIKNIKKCITDGKALHPRRFCRRWFGLESVNEYGKPRYTEDYILAMESEHGYREKCINLIARILKIKPNTIHRWGKGVEFDKIPTDKRWQYEIYLGYVDSLRVFAMSLAEMNENSVFKLLHQLEKES